MASCNYKTNTCKAEGCTEPCWRCCKTHNLHANGKCGRRKRKTPNHPDVHLRFLKPTAYPSDVYLHILWNRRQICRKHCEKIALGESVRTGVVKVLVGTDGVGVGLDLPIKTLWMLHGAHGVYEFAQIAQRAGRCASLGHATVKLHMVSLEEETMARNIQRLNEFRNQVLVESNGDGALWFKDLWKILNSEITRPVPCKPGRQCDFFERNVATAKNHFAQVQTKCKEWHSMKNRPCPVCYALGTNNHGSKRGQYMFGRCKRCLSDSHKSTKDCSIHYREYFSLQGLRQCECCTLTDSLSLEITQDRDYKHTNDQTFGSGCDAMYGQLRGGWLLEFCWSLRRFHPTWLQSLGFRPSADDRDYAKWLFRITPSSHIPWAISVLALFIDNGPTINYSQGKRRAHESSSSSSSKKRKK